MNVLEEFAPMKKCVAVDRASNPWYSDEIAEAKRLRRQLEKKWRRTKLTVDRKNFTTQRQAVLTLITEAKSKHFEELLTDCPNQRDVYKVVNSMLHCDKKSILPFHSCDYDLSEKFNKFFITKVTDIRARLDAAALHQPDLQGVHINSIHQMTDQDQPRLDSFQPASMCEIRKIIFSSPATSCSSDPVPTTLLKKHMDTILPSLALIVNKSLEDGIFPDSFKQAVVVPLLKNPT